MSFFDKLNQFREVKESAKGNGSNNENSDWSVASSSLRFDQQPLDQKLNSGRDSFDQDPLSIRDLWQQAVEMHREKVEHSKTEELVEDMPVADEKGSQALIPIIATSERLGEYSLEPVELPKDQNDPSAIERILKEEEVPAQTPSHKGEMEERSRAENLTSELQDEEEDNESAIQSLFDISPEALQEDIDQAVISIYAYIHQQSENWFGLSLPEKELSQLKESKLGEAFQAIKEVHSEQGYIYPHSVQAAQQLLPLLWKGSIEREYQIPQSWYETPLGYLFRYILSGTRQHAFDPIDASLAAAMLNWTEKEVIENYPQLGGVKLDSGYVFSRQKIRESSLARIEESPSLSMDLMEQYYHHTKQGLTRLMRIRELMNEMYDELRSIRELLISGTDFVRNRIKLPVKMQIEKRLCDLYQKYKEMHEYSFSEMQMNRKDFIGYTVPNVFQTLDQLGGTVINAENLVRSLEQSIQLVGDERDSLFQLTSRLTTNLGQLSIERELYNIKQEG